MVAGHDLAGASIGPFERMVLDAIDGKRSTAAIAEEVGLGTDDVERMLASLVASGAVAVDQPPAAKAAEAVVGSDGVDPSLDLAPELQLRVLELSTKLDELDHYQLLGVPRDAERKAVKSAYYGFAAKFHTDRHFGKNLGALKSKMETIFGRATVAHDVLSRKEQREEYDRYLAERDRTRAFEELLAAVDEGRDLFATPPRVATPLPSDGRIAITSLAEERAAPSNTPLAEKPISSTPPGPARITLDFEGSAEPPPDGAPSTPNDLRARREALARRLGGGRPRPTGAGAAPAGAPGTPLRKATAEEGRAATETIKRLYEDRREHARKAQAQRMVEAGEAALAKDDVVGAVNHYRLAVQYTDDPEAHAKFKEVSQKAREVLFEAYMKQGRYEESQGKWKECAASFAKACEAHPDDPDIAAAVAQALRREGRDLHRAARYGEMAVQKNPNHTGFRVTLGTVYLDAGLFLRARTELEAASKLSPDDAKIKELLNQVRKMLA